MNNHRIRKVAASTGMITTVAGSGATSYGGDNGQATSANLYHPVGITLDTSGTHSSFLLFIPLLTLLVN